MQLPLPLPLPVPVPLSGSSGSRQQPAGAAAATYGWSSSDWGDGAQAAADLAPSSLAAAAAVVAAAWPEAATAEESGALPPQAPEAGGEVGRLHPEEPAFESLVVSCLGAGVCGCSCQLALLWSPAVELLLVSTIELPC